MIKVSHLSKRIGDVQALNDLSFVAQNGQITGLLGPNGAGKTTCLRTIFGLLKPDNGKAEIEGIDVAIDPIGAKQQLGLFPDPFGLYERLTPREYIRYFAELSGLSSKEAKEATSQVIAKLRLEDISDRRCKGFSQGQRMKTALAQAIVHLYRRIILTLAGQFTGTPLQVDADHVIHAKRPHGEAELLQRLVDFVGQCTFEQQLARFSDVASQHAVADEARAITGNHRHLADTLAELPCRLQHCRMSVLAAHNLQQLHDVCRAEKVQTDHVLWAAGGCSEKPNSTFRLLKLLTSMVCMSSPIFCERCNTSRRRSKLSP